MARVDQGTRARVRATGEGLAEMGGASEAAAKPAAKEETGLARLCLIWRTADPEPVEFGNVVFLAILVASYYPQARAMLYDPLHLEPAGLLATLALLLIPLALYAIVWQPAGVLRRVTLMAKAAMWAYLASGVGLAIGPNNVRTALCLVLMVSSLWAAYRVGQRVR